MFKCIYQFEHFTQHHFNVNLKKMIFGRTPSNSCPLKVYGSQGTWYLERTDHETHTKCWTNGHFFVNVDLPIYLFLHHSQHPNIIDQSCIPLDLSCGRNLRPLNAAKFVWLNARLTANTSHLSTSRWAWQLNCLTGNNPSNNFINPGWDLKTWRELGHYLGCWRPSSSGYQYNCNQITDHITPHVFHQNGFQRPM